MIRLEKAGVRWEAQPDIAPLLDEILSAPGTTIKESPAKLVTANRVRDKIYYLKHYRHAAVPLRPWKFFFKKSQAGQEWELAQKLEALGLPIVRHAALGERWGWNGLQESILITECFEGKPLNEVPDIDPHKVLHLIDRMHELGVIQQDMHEGNILVSPATGEMRLVDLYHTEIKSNIGERERMLNLALLRIHLPVKVSPEVLELSRTERQRRLEHRSQRCLGADPRFTSQSFGGLKWRVRTQFQSAEVERILVAPEEFLAQRAKILKPGRSSTVGSADGLVLKRYNFRKFENLFKDLFRRSKARQAFQKGYHLELAGIPTARPIAVAERRVAGFLLRSYLLMEEVPGSAHLGQWTGDKEQAIQSLAMLLARLHREGFSHRDLKETNLLFDRDGKLFLIDLEGLRFMGTVPPARVEADLARLERALGTVARFSPEDRVALRKRYDELRMDTHARRV